MASTHLQGTVRDEFLPLSTCDAHEGMAQPAVPEANIWERRSGFGFSATAVSIAMLMATAVAATALQIVRTPATPSQAAAHPRELTLREFSKVRKLQPTGSAEAVPKAILKYQSVDERGEPGAFLGSMDKARTKMASDVELDATHPTNMTFIVGPGVEGAGPLVHGDLTVGDDCAFGMCGTIRAGLANTHPALSGTWQTEGTDLDSIILIRWNESNGQIDQNLTWNPIGEDSQANSASITDDTQEAYTGNECERLSTEDVCSQHKPTDSLCFCSWGGDNCMMACA